MYVFAYMAYVPLERKQTFQSDECVCKQFNLHFFAQSESCFQYLNANIGFKIEETWLFVLFRI